MQFSISRLFFISATVSLVACSSGEPSPSMDQGSPAQSAQHSKWAVVGREIGTYITIECTDGNIVQITEDEFAACRELSDEQICEKFNGRKKSPRRAGQPPPEIPIPRSTPKPIAIDPNIPAEKDDNPRAAPPDFQGSNSPEMLEQLKRLEAEHLARNPPPRLNPGEKIFIQVPIVQQCPDPRKPENTCAAVALAGQTGLIRPEHDVREIFDEIVKQANSIGVHIERDGIKLEPMARLTAKISEIYDVESQYVSLTDELVHSLQNGVPVLVAIAVGGGGDISDHAMLIVGYDANGNVYLADGIDGVETMPWIDFIKRATQLKPKIDGSSAPVVSTGAPPASAPTTAAAVPSMGNAMPGMPVMAGVIAATGATGTPTMTHAPTSTGTLPVMQPSLPAGQNVAPATPSAPNGVVAAPNLGAPSTAQVGTTGETKTSELPIHGLILKAKKR